MAATVTADFGNGHFSWPAELTSLEGVLDRNARTMNAVIQVANPDRPGTPVDGQSVAPPPLLPGMYARVSLEGLNAGIAAIVPRAALQPGPFVWTLDGEDTLRAVPVQIAFTRDDTVAVTAAEMPTSRSVVITQLPAATEGMHVRALTTGDLNLE